MLPSLLWSADRDGPKKPVEFFAEEITLSVDDSSATVTGIFHFRNRTSMQGKYSCIFPFYVDSLSAYPDSIAAATLGPDGSPIEVRQNKDKGAAVLKVPLTPDTITTWRITYKQNIRGRSARYILTSTQDWGRPLDEATYCIIVPSKFDSVSVWPEQDSVARRGDLVEFWAHRKNFMPDKDMQVTWVLK
jgi:hypothetical protein